MQTPKLLQKYLVLLLINIVLLKFLQPYGLKLYYTANSDPSMSVSSVNTIQSVLTSSTFLFNLIVVVFILIDSKKKKTIDWLIAAITFFTADIGVILFLVWQIYKENRVKLN